MCGITGRSYRLSGYFNQRTVSIEIAGKLTLLFFIVFVGVAVNVVGVGVAVIVVAAKFSAIVTSWFLDQVNFPTWGALRSIW